MFVINFHKDKDKKKKKKIEKKEEEIIKLDPLFAGDLCFVRLI